MFPVIQAGKPLKNAQKAIILLHGRGGSAEDILSLGGELADENSCLLAPQASQGTWYPRSFLAERQENEPFLSQSIEQVDRLIQETSQTISLNHIALVGFSQGACLALEVAARNPRPYLCVAAFTGGLIGKMLPSYNGDFQQTPIFIGCGDHDPHVPLQRCEESKAILISLNANVLLKVYPNRSHTISFDEIENVRFLLNR